jgi:hypothetical protein
MAHSVDEPRVDLIRASSTDGRVSGDEPSMARMGDIHSQSMCIAGSPFVVSGFDIFAHTCG